MSETDKNVKERLVVSTTKQHRNLEHNNPIEFEFLKNGDMVISDSVNENVDAYDIATIYLYAEQVEQLLTKLKEKCNGKNCPYYDGK